MRYLVAAAALAVTIHLIGATAWADLAPPPPDRRAPGKKPAAEGTPLAVSVEEGKPARLVIPRKLLEGAKAKKATAGATTKNSTMVAGAAIALAAVSLGLIIRRSGRTAAAALVVLSVVAGSWAVADVLPFPPERENDPAKFNVQIEIVEEGDAIQLIVDHPLQVAPPEPAAAPAAPEAP